ncbi:hypothetical protein SAMN02745866_01315 [Alteromonadaceae bacterium Bs31]|nr:hypothetical protein SAMN02745866_01315 [Alteromonadaceae bacterium Bs31]
MNSQSENEQYNLVFRGILAKGVEAKVAKRNLAHLFKIDANKVESLFSGKPVVLKRGLSLDVASKYRVAIKKAGALVDVELCQPAAKPGDGKVSDRKVSDGKANFSTPDTSEQQKPGLIPGTETATETESAHSEGDDQRSAGFGLAPVGVDLLKPDEKSVVEPVEVDISALSLKEASGKLLNEDEYRAEESLSLDLSEFDLAEPGADVLRPDERKAQPQRELDLSALSLAAPGSKLAPDKPSPPPAPNVDGITFADEG